MKLSNKDRDNLIIVGVLVGIIFMVVFFYKSTRFLPLKWIGVICCIMTLVLYAQITKKYLELYRLDAGVGAYVPIFNCINIFPRSIALLVCVDLAVCAVSALITFIPADVLVHIMNSYTAMNIGDVSLSVLYVAIYVMFIILGSGFCAVYHDVRRMLHAVTGMKRPKSEFINYPLMFLPVISILGLSSILSGLNTLQRYGYHEGELEEETVLNEV